MAEPVVAAGVFEGRSRARHKISRTKGRPQAFPPWPKLLDTVAHQPNDGCPWLVHVRSARVVARMIRLRLGVDDVARTRFAAPGPYCELSVSAQVIQQPTSSFRRLSAASGVRLPASASHLLELVPAHGNVPDFLAPEGANSLEEALDIVMSTPDRLIRNDMATLPRRVVVDARSGGRLRVSSEGTGFVLA